MKLNPKQKKFIKEYLLNGNNAADAARKAGYTGNDDTIRAMGAENLTKPHIREEIEKLQAKTEKKLEEKFQVTQDMIIDELVHMGFAKSTDVYDLSDPTDIKMKSQEEMGRRGATYIDAIKIKREQIIQPAKKKKRGAPEEPPKKPEFAVTELRITLLGKEKIKALELLGKQIGMFDGRVGSNTDGRKLVLDRLQKFFQKNRRDGSGSGT